MLNGFELFKLSRVVKLHFTSEKYNIFNAKGKSRGLTFENYLKAIDYKLYESTPLRFNDAHSCVQFLVANQAYKHTNPIHDLSVSERNYHIWNKRRQMISNVFREDLSNISLHMDKKDKPFASIFDSSGSLPELFKIYLSGVISIESMYLINKMHPYLERWRSANSLIWDKDFLLIEKLDKFVEYDKDVITKIYLSNST